MTARKPRLLFCTCQDRTPHRYVSVVPNTMEFRLLAALERRRVDISPKCLRYAQEDVDKRQHDA